MARYFCTLAVTNTYVVYVVDGGHLITAEPTGDSSLLRFDAGVEVSRYR